MESNLRDAFFGAMEAYATAEGLPVVSFPNISYEPPKSNDTYLKAWVLPTRPEVLTLCKGMARHIWVLQVSVYTRRGVGERKGTEQADKLRAQFPVTHKFSSGGDDFTVITPPSPNPAIPVDGWNLLPVQFRASIIN